MIVLDPGSAVLPSEQIRGQIAGLIRSGSVAGGQRLPSVRQLAADLRVAPGTVAKAYSALEAEGLLESSRTRGTRVALHRAHPEDVRRAARRYVDAVAELGLEQALGAVRAAWLARASDLPGASAEGAVPE